MQAKATTGNIENEEYDQADREGSGDEHDSSCIDSSQNDSCDECQDDTTEVCVSLPGKRKVSTYVPWQISFSSRNTIDIMHDI